MRKDFQLHKIEETTEFSTQPLLKMRLQFNTNDNGNESYYNGSISPYGGIFHQLMSSLILYYIEVSVNKTSQYDLKAVEESLMCVPFKDGKPASFI